ncbi:hypothetical protein C0Q70_13221 [Pomacea canaliculata]|uniref:Uncharacterized protein n=1 Tax=Pomacea canaliculata TaxID=400727 RepID=A0A2T7NWM0_POMCA|nr:hypothetical protein C0Q70_13221 [Pomacea canaliculata]
MRVAGSNSLRHGSSESSRICRYETQHHDSQFLFHPNVVTDGDSNTVESRAYQAVSLAAYIVSFTVFFFFTCAIVFFIKRRQSRRLQSTLPPPPATREVAVISRVEGGVQFSPQSGVHVASYGEVLPSSSAGISVPVLTPPPYSTIAFDNYALDVTSECDLPPPYSERDICTELSPAERKDNR